MHAFVADMTKQSDIAKMVETAKEKLGGVDILVNNAGQMYSGRFAAINDDEMQTQLDTKLFGFLRAIRAVYPMMKAQKWGRIVNTIGGAGKEPDPYMFGSGMTNSALLNLTKSLSTEFGEDNVLVNAICPGWVATDLWVRNTEGMKKEFGVASEAEARKVAAKKNALGRMGKPEELANATVFLCSERASYITGVSLNTRRRTAERVVVSRVRAGTLSLSLRSNLHHQPLRSSVAQRRERRAAVISAATFMAASVTARPRSVSVTARRRRSFRSLSAVRKPRACQPVDHALDGGGVEIDQPAEMVLRARPDFVELGERGELRLRQPLDHARHEDRGVALHGDAHQEADLIVEHVAAVHRPRASQLSIFRAASPSISTAACNPE